MGQLKNTGAAEAVEKAVLQKEENSQENQFEDVNFQLYSNQRFMKKR